MTVLPFVAGISTFIGAWALGLRPDLGAFAILAGGLGSAGVFLTKLITSGEDRARKAIVELQNQAHDTREKALDDLAQRLEDDRDPRTETALGDLRELARALDELDEDGYIDNDNPTVIEIKLGATQLFEQCVQSLEQSLKLWHTAQRMRTISARQPILDQRERIVEDVYRSVRDLGNLLVALQSLSVADDNSTELSRIRNELKENLEVARQVDKRLRDFENEVESRARE